jgi:hypothetical protein
MSPSREIGASEPISIDAHLLPHRHLFGREIVRLTGRIAEQAFEEAADASPSRPGRLPPKPEKIVLRKLIDIAFRMFVRFATSTIGTRRDAGMLGAGASPLPFA